MGEGTHSKWRTSDEPTIITKSPSKDHCSFLRITWIFSMAWQGGWRANVDMAEPVAAYRPAKIE